MILADDGVPADVARPVDDPVADSLAFEPALVADPVFHLAVTVLDTGDAVDLIPLHPHRHLSAALRAVAVRVYRVREPHTLSEAECTVSQRADGTNIDHVS